MAYGEVDSFLLKFKYLWHAGVQASLKIESKDGKANVCLSSEVGSIPPPFPPQSKKKRNQAYIRRQEKRNAARQEAEKASANESMDGFAVVGRKDAERVSANDTKKFLV